MGEIADDHMEWIPEETSTEAKGDYDFDNLHNVDETYSEIEQRWLSSGSTYSNKKINEPPF